MKKIPYGKTNYKNLIENNCLYVDKTMYLEKLESYNDTLIYLRPRRFGKTLFTSMMCYYYDINSKESYDKLFNDTYVYSHPTKNKNSYYILKFDFSGISGATSEEKLETNFNDSVITSIKNFLAYYNLNIELDYDKKASVIMDNLLSNLYGKYPVYVIIDEYDNFTNSLLKEDAHIFTKILGKDGFVRDFYAILKKHNGTNIKKIFITGVCSISIDSMTSGFNIGTNITNNFEFNTMTGITHDELKKLIEYLNIKEDTFNIMEENYDGYKFSINTKEKVFNPNLVMYFLNYYTRYNMIPNELLDSNIYSDYNQIKNIICLFDNNIYKNIINEILENKYVYGILKENFTLTPDTFDKNYIISLLYYFGYLTIDKYDETLEKTILFKIPNLVMRRVFIEYFIGILKSSNK